jgi:hypothetical protein
LKIAVSELATAMPSGGKARNGKKEAIAEVDGLLQQLDVVETYWAYPGREAVRGCVHHAGAAGIPHRIGTPHIETGAHSGERAGGAEHRRRAQAGP